MSGVKTRNPYHVRHLAYQIMTQLPEEPAEALMVLECVRRMIQQPVDETVPPIPVRLVKKES